MQWGPAILAGVQAMRLALMAGRVLGIPLPTLPTDDLKAAVSGAGGAFESGSIFDSYSDKIAAKALNSMWDTLAELNVQESLDWGAEVTEGSLKTDVDGVDFTQSSIVKLSGDAYSSIETFLTTGENQKLGSIRNQLKDKMMRLRGADGAVEW